MGRPSNYNDEIADLICEKISTTTVGLNRICEADDMPCQTTVYKWLREHSEFAQKYARAHEARAHLLIGEILEIADDGTNDYMTITKGDMEYNVEDKEVTNRSKLRVEARKWIASKLLPKVYGDKLDLTTGGEKIGINFKDAE